MELIKIEYDNKIFKITKPQSFAELLAKLRCKFGPNQVQKSRLFYTDSESENIEIESDDDFKIAMTNTSRISLLILQPIPQTTVSDLIAITHSDLSRLVREFESTTKGKDLQKAQRFLSETSVPCICCISTPVSAKDPSVCERNHCRLCKSTGKRRITKLWSFISFLIDCKIKEFILNPLQNLTSESNSVSLTKHEFADDSTNISVSAPTLNSAFAKPPIPKSPDLQVKILTTSLNGKNSLNDTKMNNSKISTSSFLKLPAQKNSTFTLERQGFFEITMPSFNKTVQEKLTHNKPLEDEKYYTKEQLLFGVLKAEAWLSKNNIIEVSLLIENQSGKNWPEGVWIRGRDNGLTQNVNHKLEKRLRTSSIIGIKFNFGIKGDLLGRYLNGPLVFEFFATDFRINVKYVSKPLKVELSIKKKCSKLNYGQLIARETCL